MSQDEVMREAMRAAERAGVRLVPRPPDDALSFFKVIAFRSDGCGPASFTKERIGAWLASFGESDKPWGCEDREVVPEPPDELILWLSDLSSWWHWDEERFPNLANRPTALPKQERDMRKMLHDWIESWGGHPQPP